MTFNVQTYDFPSSVLDKISRTAVIESPFLHLVLSDVFDSELYSTILRHIPASAEIATLAQIDMGISQQRCIVDVERFHSPFWNEYAAQLSSPYFVDRLLQKFGLKYESQFYVTIQLVQDRLGYEIGPHTDIDSKILTMLFYLPIDNSMLECGTSICAPLDPRLVGSQDHHTWTHFREDHVILFRPNSALAFRRTDHSFHAVRPVNRDIIRNSLALTIRSH